MWDAGRIKNSVFRLLLLFLIVSLCGALDSALTETPITSDARQNLQAAYNLNAWGVFSTAATSEKPSADNYREPLTPFITSLFIRLYEKFYHNPAFEDLASGRLCRTIKKINLFWAFFLLFGSAALVVVLTRSTIFAGLSVILIYLCFLRNPEYIDTLCTEIPAATIMIWTSVLLTMGLRSGSRVVFFGAGLLLGLLCLTKAVFLYLALPIVFIVLLCTLTSSHICKVRALTIGLLFVVGITVAAGPWVLRNYNQFGGFSLVLRGGAVLYGRTRLNSMNMDEVIAAFYLWGPGAYKKMVHNTSLEIKSEEYEEGGRAARLNRSASSDFARKDKIAEQAGKPEEAISFLRQIRAERVRVRRHFKSRGHPNPQQAADDYLKGEACRWLFEHPVRHMVMTIPFAWRGVWCFYGGGIFTVLNALCALAFLALVAYGSCVGNQRIVASTLLPFLMLCFNAFFTHNLSRYTLPAIPYLIISLFVIIHMLTTGHNKSSV
jgi:4-amino-4-deoxy-L-arabinose transferase-like glycosyltransferase